MSTYGTGLSGGDRIFIELAKRLAKKHSVSIYLWEEGLNICKREGLEDVNYVVWSAKFWAKLGFFINYLARVGIGISKAFLLKLENSSATIVYSASEFWQDSIPATILKIRYPKITWIAAWYQSAPNPFRGFREKGLLKILPNLRALLYWFVQQPVRPIIKKYADFIFITSDPDKVYFPKQDTQGKVIVIKGGVDLDKVKDFQKKYKNIEKIYDAVFQGRLHPQKGVIELIDIWKMVVDKKPDAKLVMIGDGPLMEDVKSRITNNQLTNNVILFGYLFDGSKKYKIFSQSKVVVHPALYDSGGMAAAEAMVFGLPGVSFDLLALKTYYPKGLVKVPVGNLDKFAEAILDLLGKGEYYQKIKQQAYDLIQNFWGWDSLAERVLRKLEVEVAQEGHNK